MHHDHQTTFTQIGNVLAQQALPALHRAGQLPLRITCFGVASYDGGEADSFDRTVVIGQCSTPEEAMCLASERVACGDIRISADAALRFQPHFTVIHDSDHGVVLAGPIRASIVLWQQSVASPAEARRVVSDASRLRGLAFTASDRGERASARDFRKCAMLLEAQLVDPAWRVIAADLLRLPQAA